MTLPLPPKLPHFTLLVLLSFHGTTVTLVRSFLFMWQKKRNKTLSDLPVFRCWILLKVHPCTGWLLTGTKELSTLSDFHSAVEPWQTCPDVCENQVWLGVFQVLPPFTSAANCVSLSARQQNCVLSSSIAGSSETSTKHLWAVASSSRGCWDTALIFLVRVTPEYILLLLKAWQPVSSRAETP